MTTITHSKPTLIDNKAGTTTRFKYGPSNNRFKRIDVQSSQTTTTHYVGNIEVVTLPSGVIETKRYVSNAIQITRSNGTSTTSYLYKDHLGSIDAVTNQNGQIIIRMYFAPFGQKAQISIGQWSTTAQNNAVYTLSNLHDITNKGYTGHEHIDAFDLVHMGGRIYDPITGRFIQADPFVQEAKNSQNLNRYTYVLNNPMGYTDPSGYFFKGLVRSIAKVPLLNSAISFGLAYFCGPLCAGAYNAAVTYAVTGSLKSAAIGAFVSAATPGNNFFVVGIIGGLASKAQGGNFGHGFGSAAAGNLFAGRINTGNPYANVVVSAVIGGTISKLTGGKFSNGAQSWAFQSAIRAVSAGTSTSKSDNSNDNPTLKKGGSRKLTKGEIALIEEEFGKGVIDTNTVRIHRKKAWVFQGKSIVMAPDGDIYFHPKDNSYMDDFSLGNMDLQGLFIHEMGHVYQVQSSGETLWGLRGAFNSYSFKASDIKNGRSWESFNIEQQADIIKFHFWSKQGVFPTKWKNIVRPTTSEYEKILPYIKK